MAMPPMPHPHLIALRSVATVILSCLIGQAGWAAAFIGGQDEYRPYHAVGAWVAMVACVVGAVVYLALRRSAGLVNVVLSLVLAAAVIVQFTLGELGARSVHIFLGVLVLMLGTALTSWTYRHEMPVADVNR